MILIALGANLDSPFGSPRTTCELALERLQRRGISLLQLSPWYRTAPVPASDQPWYWNAVASVETDLGPEALLAVLHEVEADMGRVRSVANAARVLDLDLLDHDGAVIARPDLTLPHPRLHERAFVLYPLRDIAPDWRHAGLGRTAAALADALPAGQQIRPA